MTYWLVWEKIHLLRKNANIRSKRQKKGGKEEIFTVLWSKNIILEKGGGAKISIIQIIYTPVFRSMPIYSAASRNLKLRSESSHRRSQPTVTYEIFPLSCINGGKEIETSSYPHEKNNPNKFFRTLSFRSGSRIQISAFGCAHVKIREKKKKGKFIRTMGKTQERM